MGRRQWEGVDVGRPRGNVNGRKRWVRWKGVRVGVDRGHGEEGVGDEYCNNIIYDKESKSWEIWMHNHPPGQYWLPFSVALQVQQN